MIDKKQQNNNTYTKLCEQDWESLIVKLQAYTTQRIGRLSWRNGRANLPKGFRPYDITMMAIEKVYTGSAYRWDYEKQLNIYFHLTSVIDSIISNLVNSKDNTNLKSIVDNDLDFGFINDLKNIPEYENQLDYETLLLKIGENIEGEDDLELLFLCLQEDMNYEEIAHEMTIPIEQVYQLIRKFKRRLKGKGLDKF